MTKTASSTKPDQQRPYGQRPLGKVRGMLKQLTKARGLSATLIGDAKNASDQDLELAALAMDEAANLVTKIKEAGYAIRKDMQRLEREIAKARGEMSRLDQHAAEIIREIDSHARAANGELQRRSSRPVASDATSRVPDRALDLGRPKAAEDKDHKEHTGDVTDATQATTGGSADAVPHGLPGLPGLD